VPVTVTCSSEPAAAVAPTPSVRFLSAPQSLARRTMVSFAPDAPAGVRRLDVLVGSRKACAITAAPYSCAISPLGEDVGTQALRAVLTDASGATAEASRSVAIPKFSARVSLRISKWNVRGGKARRTISGVVVYPTGVERSAACASGTVTLRIKRAGRSVLNQQVGLSKTCAFTRSITTSRAAQDFSVSARFGGNAVLSTAAQTRRFS
jgi:hypothetical protein